jgi:hypothetical protein
MHLEATSSEVNQQLHLLENIAKKKAIGVVFPNGCASQLSLLSIVLIESDPASERSLESKL